MTDAATLITSFKNAIELEQKSDILLTDTYLQSYSPKKLSQLGLAVINLVVDNVREGFGGKTIIDLVQDPALKNANDKNEIQVGSLRVGDIVKLDYMNTGGESKQKNQSEETNNNHSFDCVVMKVSSQAITVSINESPKDESTLALYNNTGNDGGSRMWLVKLANVATYKRMMSSMGKLSELYQKTDNQIIKILLGLELYNQRLISGKPLKRSDLFDKNLNDSQVEAVSFAINDSPITIIHGPPGTGKTYTVIELIKQLCFTHGERVLVCGPSNISVDTILERLSSAFTNDNAADKKRSKKVKKQVNSGQLIRIGHPARLLAKNLQHSLDVLSKTNYGDLQDSKQVLGDIEKEIDETIKKVKKCKRYSERRALWTELKTLKKELKVREKKVVEELLSNAKVVLSTLHGAGNYELTSLYKDGLFNEEKPFFDTIIIDEVSQSLEPQCWIPLVNHIGFKRLVIAGDNMQLPPTVKSKDEFAKVPDIGSLRIDDNSVSDLEVTLFDRLMQYHEGEKYKKLLNIQYRMNQKIMQFPSDELYDGSLLADKSVANINLCDLDDVIDCDATESSCIWYDTQGGDYPEKSNEDEHNIESVGSKFNEMEVLVVIQHIKALMKAGVPSEAIGVISPYNAQVSLIKKSLVDDKFKAIEVSTVDGFQGREKEVIIISLVRSNENGDVGFLRDKRRLNVAMTRPKRQLCVVGDLSVLKRSGVEFLHRWSEFVEDERDDSGSLLETFQILYPDLEDYW